MPPATRYGSRMNRLVRAATAASAVALALPVAGCGSTSSKTSSAAKSGGAPAALIAASNGYIAALERNDAAAVCSYFTPRGRAFLVTDAHFRGGCTRVVAAVFKSGLGGHTLDYRPVGPVQVTRVQTYGAVVVLSYRDTDRGATIPWLKTDSGWKVDRTG